MKSDLVNLYWILLCFEMHLNLEQIDKLIYNGYTCHCHDAFIFKDKRLFQNNQFRSRVLDFIERKEKL